MFHIFSGPITNRHHTSDLLHIHQNAIQFLDGPIISLVLYMSGSPQQIDHTPHFPLNSWFPSAPRSNTFRKKRGYPRHFFWANHILKSFYELGVKTVTIDVINTVWSGMTFCLVMIAALSTTKLGVGWDGWEGGRGEDGRGGAPGGCVYHVFMNTNEVVRVCTSEVRIFANQIHWINKGNSFIPTWYEWSAQPNNRF